MAFPVHLPADENTGRCPSENVKIGNGERERGIGLDCETEHPYRVGQVNGLLRLAVERSGMDICCNQPGVVLDGTPGEGRVAMAAGGPFSVLVHATRLGPRAEAALRYY